MISQIFYTVCYQPIFNLLIWLYNIIPGHDIGLAIIALTILIRIVLMPFMWQQLKSQKALQQIQPKISALKKEYADNKEQLSKEIMRLYREEKVNPMASCLPLLIQLPFLIAVYQVFVQGLTMSHVGHLYPFIANPGTINAVSFGIVNLGAPVWWLGALAAIGQYFQVQMLSTAKPSVDSKGSQDEKILAAMNTQMRYVLPVMTFIIGLSLPGGVALYWLVFTVLTTAQQKFMFRPSPATTAIVEHKK